MVRIQLTVDRRHLRVTLFRRGHRIWRSRIGVGKASSPTPGGRFWNRERIRIKSPRGTYASFAFGTGAYSRLSDWPGAGAGADAAIVGHLDRTRNCKRIRK